MFSAWNKKVFNTRGDALSRSGGSLQSLLANHTLEVCHRLLYNFSLGKSASNAIWT